MQEQGKRMKEQTEQNQQRSQQLEASIKEELETMLKEQSEQLEAKLKEHSEKQNEHFEEAVRQLSECHKVHTV